MPGHVTSPGAPVRAGGASVLASNALPIGTRVDEFEITRVIGEGGFSVVYLAFDHTLHRSIALKEYIPSALASRRGDQTVAVRSAQHQQTFEAGLRSFINEARLLAQFDHPALVKVYRFWEGNGTAYMAMPHYEGRTLKHILREHPEQASEAWLKRLLVPLLDALALLHAHQCYHRDIAPDNIQILDNEQPVLLDFGAARRTIGDMTQAFTVILKPGYAPIEQYADETDLKQGPWTDVYALSALLYGAIVGKPPPTAVARMIKDPLEPLAARSIANFDPVFLSGIDRGLAVRPEARPQSIAAWRTLLGMDAQAAAARVAASGAFDAPKTDAWPALPAQPAQRIDASNDNAATNDASNEADRTVLVPGLRRSPARQASTKPEATQPRAAPSPAAVSPPAATDARPASADGAMHRVRHPAAIVTGVLVIAVVAWLVIARPFQQRTMPPIVAKSGEVAAAASPPPAPAPTRPKVASASVPPAPVQSSSPAQSSPPAQWQPDSRASEAMNPPERASGVGAAKAQEANAAASTATDPQSAPVAPKPPAVAEDERRWAAMRNSDNIDDLRAFRRHFPDSQHAQDAAVRIQQLVRQSRENARESAPARPPAIAPSQVAKAEPAPSLPRAQVGTGAAVATASPATVRIRVQPFGYVYVDGTLVGPSPPSRDVQLAPGRHRIEARNDQENPPVVHREIDVTGPGSTDVALRFRE
jgi:serine/threonine protein kinase